MNATHLRVPERLPTGVEHAVQPGGSPAAVGLQPARGLSDWVAETLGGLFNPEQNRYCWIKADPTFEGLRQILYEPEDRVWIAKAPPNADDATGPAASDQTLVAHESPAAAGEDRGPAREACQVLLAPAGGRTSNPAARTQGLQSTARHHGLSGRPLKRDDAVTNKRSSTRLGSLRRTTGLTKAERFRSTRAWSRSLA